MFDNNHMASRHRRKKVVPPLRWRDVAIALTAFVVFGAWFMRGVVRYGIRRPRLGQAYHNYATHSSRKPEAGTGP